VQVLKLEEHVPLARVLSRPAIVSVSVRTAQRVVEEVPVVILPVRVTSEPEETRYGDDEDGRAVEGINVTRDKTDRIGDKSPAADCEDEYESPQPPVCLENFKREEILLRGCLLQVRGFTLRLVYALNDSIMGFPTSYFA